MSKLLAFPQYMYLYFNITNLLTIVLRKAPNLEIVLFHDHRIQKDQYVAKESLFRFQYPRGDPGENKSSVPRGLS